MTEVSSELIHYGDMHKINSGGWHQERTFFLFDHQLIYCKKVTKRHHRNHATPWQINRTAALYFLILILDLSKSICTILVFRIFCDATFSSIAAESTLTSAISKTSRTEKVKYQLISKKLMLYYPIPTQTHRATTSGRICISDENFSFQIKNGIKLFDRHRQKCAIVYCKTVQQKNAWIQATRATTGGARQALGR